MVRTATGRGLALAFLVAAVGCDDDPSSPPFPETHGISPRTLDSVYAHAEAIPHSMALLVQRNGVLVREAYFHGHRPDSIHDVRSVTKSVVSILTGIAISQAIIPTVDQPIGTYLRSVVDSISDEKAAVSLRHYLMMSSGLDWHELDRGTSYGDWWRSDDMIQFVVDLPMVHQPGERFIYNTGASHLLSVVLTEATGMPTLEFARQMLFEPLGIHDSSWLQENRGYDTGGMGLRITARAMMKVGQMFLDGGVYGETRVVPEEWVAQSTAPLLSTEDATAFGQSYGYLWWVGEGGGRDFFLASGYGGQFILVDPDLDLVVVTQSEWRGKGWDLAGEQWYRTLELIVNGLLPAVE
jgi:CubicO group peptidase (beta-lactamase class C family)